MEKPIDKSASLSSVKGSAGLYEVIVKVKWNVDTLGRGTCGCTRIIFHVVRAPRTVQKLFPMVLLQHCRQEATLEVPILLTEKQANLSVASGSELLHLRSFRLQSSYSLAAHGTEHSHS